jgi:hypothetical protein
MVAIAVWVFPIERHRPSGNFDVVNGDTLGKRRVAHDVDRAFRTHTIAAHLYVRPQVDPFPSAGAKQ